VYYSAIFISLLTLFHFGTIANIIGHAINIIIDFSL